MTSWFDDLPLVQQLPYLFRLYAAYSRLAVSRTSGRVWGGSLAHRVLSVVTSRLHLQDAVPIAFQHGVQYVDLLDARFLTVLHEARADDSEKRLLERVLAKGDAFIDVGANHGSFAIHAARMIGPEGVVIACEPQPRLAGLLRQSFVSNGYRRATVHQVACTDYEGTADLFIPDAGSGSASLFRSFVNRGRYVTVPVAGARLDTLIAAEALPDRVFIKVDVEGSELAFLRGAEQTFRSRRPLVLFEINPSSARAAGHTVDDLFDFFARIGYGRFAEPGEYPQSKPVEAIERGRQRNLVAIPDGGAFWMVESCGPGSDYRG